MVVDLHLLNFQVVNSPDNCIHHYSVKILNVFNPKLQMSNTKPVIENKLNGLLSELRKIKVQTKLVLDYKTIIKKTTVKSSVRVLN